MDLKKLSNVQRFKLSSQGEKETREVCSEEEGRFLTELVCSLGVCRGGTVSPRLSRTTEKHVPTEVRREESIAVERGGREKENKGERRDGVKEREEEKEGNHIQ